MDETDLCANRSRFLCENAPEILDILEVWNDQTITRHFINFAKFPQSLDYKSLFESLKNATDNEFLLICHCILESGHYSLFSEMLDRHFVDCESLEKLTKLFMEKNFSIILNLTKKMYTKENRRDCEPLSTQKIKFLQRHKFTIRSLIRMEHLIEYLKWTNVISITQFNLIKNLPINQGLDVLVDFLTSQQISVYSIDQFCHGLLLTAQYKLYSILHNLVDSKRLEILFKEYASFLVENGENLYYKNDYHNENYVNEELLTSLQNTNKTVNTTTNMIIEECYGSMSNFKEELMEEELDEQMELLPDGLLTDLSVDMTDSFLAREFFEAHKNEVYKNFSTPKGLAMIINNRKFRAHSERKGTAVDERNIANLLNQLGYRVLPPLEDLTAEQMREQAIHFARLPDHANLHSCIVVVLSHGEYDSITGVDGEQLSTFNFFSIFNSRNAPNLAGKPRIFIIQACRGVMHDVGIQRFLDYDEPDGTHLSFRKSSKRKPNFQQISTRNSDLFENKGINSSTYKNINQNDNNNNKNQFSSPITKSSTSNSIFATIKLRLGFSKVNAEKHYRNRQENGSGEFTISSTINNVELVGSSLDPLTSLPSTTSTIRAIQRQSDLSSITSPGVMISPRGLRRFFPAMVQPNEEPQIPRPRRVVHEPTDTDMLIAYATTPNYVSWRNSEFGTWFIQAICEIFAKHAKHEDILTMFTRVNNLVASKFKSSTRGEKQTPEYTSRLRQKFYFFPGWQNNEKSQTENLIINSKRL